MTKSEWIKIRKSWPGIWRHVSGWEVFHCGHPTANWPYYGVPPGKGAMCPQSEMLLSGGIGRGCAFRLLALAQDAVEQVVREAVHAETETQID